MKMYLTKLTNMTRRNAVQFELPLAYNNFLPITGEKKKDLLSLLCFILDIFHDFNKNLKISKEVQDPLLSESGNDKLQCFLQIINNFKK